MRYLTLFLVVIPFLFTPAAYAESKMAIPAPAVGTTIDITAPLDGSRINARGPHGLDYEINLSGEDDHAFVYIDGQQVQKLRRMKGSYTLEFIPLGEHEICIKIAYKDHSLTGTQRCIKVTFGNLGRLY